VFFYFWAGLLKINSEWISGANLYDIPWFLEGPQLKWATMYVIALELIFVWALFSKKQILFYSVLAQLVLFHLVSFWIVGYFYPVLMFLFLGFLWWDFHTQENATKLKLNFRSLSFLGVFAFFQILPLLIPGKAALTGEGRLLALHMFDAKVECVAQLNIRRADAPNRIEVLKVPAPIRIQCDPILFLQAARDSCKKIRALPQFIDIDLSLKSKTQSQSDWVQVIDQKDFCHSKPDYNPFWSNKWILKGSKS